MEVKTINSAVYNTRIEKQQTSKQQQSKSFLTIEKRIKKSLKYFSNTNKKSILKQSLNDVERAK
jgi:hypothetical protein